MTLTNRPTRGRLPIWHFYNDPNYFKIENILDCDLDFYKPTTYYGHEYHLLKHLNRNKNKLIFTLRNFKENVFSDVLIKYGLNRVEIDPIKAERFFKREVLQNRSVFKEYIIRLKLFDDWNHKYRLLIPFEDLVHHPEKFVPDLLAFIGDEVDSTIFIKNYAQFK